MNLADADFVVTSAYPTPGAAVSWQEIPFNQAGAGAATWKETSPGNFALNYPCCRLLSLRYQLSNLPFTRVRTLAQARIDRREMVSVSQSNRPVKMA